MAHDLDDAQTEGYYLAGLLAPGSRHETAVDNVADDRQPRPTS